MHGATARHPAEDAGEHEAAKVARQVSEHARFIRTAAARVSDQPDDRAAKEILLHAARRLTDFEEPLEQEALSMRQAAAWIELGRMLERADAEARKAAESLQRGKRGTVSHLRSVPGAA